MGALFTAARLEVSTACQLACPSCPTAQGRIPPGMLALADLDRFLTLNPGLRELELSNYGEAFLHKGLPQILERLARAGVAATLANGVNLNHASPEQLEALVVHGVRRITVSIDGTDDETYARYRRRGSLARVLGHIDELNRLKRVHGRREPELRWQFIVFEHNRHQLARAREMAAERDMTFFEKQDWATERYDELPVSAAAPPELARHPMCQQLYTAPQVNWNGDLLGCCVNFWRPMGNAFEQSLDELAASGSFARTRDMLVGRSWDDASPCVTCGVFAGVFRDERGRYLRVAPVPAALHALRTHPAARLVKLRLFT